ncbi:MAG: TetR/AcrR family transcriptional regulator [Hyphomonadaceae bacterium]|nr:TetR/AcrR family transcriptional regulator [Hyphomonadaceae bacterium]GIK50154.1 MAG: TetR family transcriptional regulator [Alphaproteobacteria bacterium]
MRQAQVRRRREATETKSAAPPPKKGRPLGRPPAKGRHDAPTDERIKTTATRLFFERGFNATTTRDITEECALTPGALYNHFGSKDALLFAIINETHEELWRTLQEAVPETGKPADRLSSYVRAFVLFHIDRREAALVANQEFKFLSGKPREHVRRARRKIRTLLEQILSAGMQAGAFKVSSPSRATGVGLLATSITNMCLRVSEWFSPSGPLGPEALADWHADLVLGMVSKE